MYKYVYSLQHATSMPHLYLFENTEIASENFKLPCEQLLHGLLVMPYSS